MDSIEWIILMVIFQMFNFEVKWLLASVKNIQQFEICNQYENKRLKALRIMQSLVNQMRTVLKL
jgi:hypothetical protein